MRPDNETGRRKCGISALISISSLAISISTTRGAAADLVDITAEFRCTNRVRIGTNQYPREWRHSVHCVVGTNLWFIEGDFASNADVSRLFTGSNVVEDSVLNKGFAAGKRWTNTWVSDGVISNGVGAQNLAWLAFCSGPYLKKVRVIPLPCPNGYFPDNVNHDHRQVFHDELGLPSSVEFFLPRPLPYGSRTAYWPDGSYK